jgi:cell division protein YceG involved in septum cleavage
VVAVVALLIAAAVVFVLVRSLRHTHHAKPPPAPAVVHVLIPEGVTRLQIAEIAKRDGLAGSYRVASRRSSLLSPQEYGAPATTKTLEGFLFPATYDEYPRAPVDRLVADQLTAFKENLPTDIVARAKALHLSVYGVLIVASMVEREARLAADRSKVAAVIYNRLRIGMPLAVDATLYYAIELQKDVPTYTAELTESQLRMNSAYNTRIRKGLPPTPISNPGLAAIQAAAHPAAVPYLYYVNGADGCGELAFSTSAARFQADVAAYQAALAANHGHPPRCKGHSR